MKRAFSKRFRRLASVVMAAALIFANLPPMGVITYAEPVTVDSHVEPTDAARRGTTETDDVTLLAGNNDDLRGDDLASTIANYDKTFLLGVAADFCVFLEDYFHVLESDAEGRVAVGGNFIVDTPWSKPPSYTVGAGDYNTHTPLDTLLKDRLGSATIIIGGTDDGVLKNGKLSDAYYENGELHEGNADHKSTRRLVMNYTEGNLPSDWYVTNLEGDTTDENEMGNIPVRSGPGAYQKVDQTQTYVYPLLNFQTEFNKLLVRRSQLKSNKDSGTVSWDPNSKTLTFTYTGNQSDKLECVYFSLDDTTFAYFQQATTIKFENIPSLPVPKTIVNNDGTESEWYTSYIVVNVAVTGEESSHSEIETGKTIYFVQNENDGRDKETFINGQSIFNGPAGTRITDNVNNNHPGAASLLYNFYGADEDTTLVLGSNFQGTIFAPLSHVTDWATINNDEKHGHLSGALVAKSFKGKTEFGYRPFTGGIKLAEASTDYRIAINKYDKDDEELPEASRTPLVGAIFGIFEVAEDGTVATRPVQTMTTTEDQDFISLTSGRYVLREISAPAGYALSDEEYYFEVKDTDYTVKILETSDGDDTDYTVLKVFTGTDEESGELIYENHDFDEESGEILTVTLPRVEIDIYKDKEKSEMIAGYTYSAFRADQRTYKINGHEVKFRFFDKEGSMLDGVGEMIIDGETYEWGSTEFNAIYDKLTFIRIRGMSGTSFHDEDNYYAYVVLYDGDPIFPVVTLTRVLVEHEDNNFEGFNFYDEKAIEVNKIDENGKALTGADIRLENETYTVSGGSYSSTYKDVGEPAWKWDRSSSSTVKLSDIGKISYDNGYYSNIYRITEDNAPEGYKLIDKDTVFIWFGDYIYINEEVPRDEALQYLPVYWDGSQLVENSDYEANGWTRKNITLPENRVIYIRNAKIEGANFTLKKVNQSGTPISGANIALYYYDPSTGNEELIKEWESFTGEIDFVTDLGDSDSKYVKHGYLIPGTYYLVENNAPAGYKPDLEGEKLFFTVDEDFNITKGYTKVNAVEAEIKETSESGSWSGLTYKDITVEGATRFEIQFSSLNSEGFNIWRDVYDNANSTEQNYNISFPSSWVNESDTNHYYQINDDKKYIYDFITPTTFNIRNLQIQGNDMEVDYVRFYTGDGETVGTDSALIIEGDGSNGYTLSIPNETDGYQIGVSKVDESGNLLPGAEITLYSIDEDGNETVVETKTSEDGRYIFNAAAGTKYVIRETKAPNGYALSDEAYYFEITTEGVIEDVVVKEDYTAKIYNVENGDITQDDISAGNYAPAAEAPSDGQGYFFTDWNADSSVKWIETISWSIDWSKAQPENSLVQSLEFLYDGGGSCTIGYGAWLAWSNWTLNLENFTENDGDKARKITEIKATLKETDTNENVDITISFKDGSSQSCTVETSTDKQAVVTILGGGSTQPVEYYKIVGTDKESKPGTPAVWQSDIEGNEYWVEADVHETKERFSASKVTLNVYADEDFTKSAKYSVTYNDSLDVKNNTYVIGEDTYTFTVDEDGTISAITKNGDEFEDTYNRFKAVKVRDGYVIVDNEGEDGNRILYPTLVNLDELLLTEGLPEDITIYDGFKIVNEPEGQSSPKEIYISKKDAVNEGIAGAADLAGATLKLTLKTPDNAGDTLEGVTVSGVDSEMAEDKKSITWESSDTPAKFTGLPDGKYILKEVSAPEEYEKLTEQIEFEIRDGNLYMNSELVANSLVEIFNQRKNIEADVELPEAGGMGIYWICMIGACLIGIVINSPTFKKRKAHKN